MLQFVFNSDALSLSADRFAIHSSSSDSSAKETSRKTRKKDKGKGKPDMGSSSSSPSSKTTQDLTDQPPSRPAQSSASVSDKKARQGGRPFNLLDLSLAEQDEPVDLIATTDKNNNGAVGADCFSYFASNSKIDAPSSKSKCELLLDSSEPEQPSSISSTSKPAATIISSIQLPAYPHPSYLKSASSNTPSVAALQQSQQEQQPVVAAIEATVINESSSETEYLIFDEPEKTGNKNDNALKVSEAPLIFYENE